MQNFYNSILELGNATKLTLGWKGYNTEQGKPYWLGGTI